MAKPGNRTDRVSLAGAHLGENLSAHPFIEVLSARSAEELKAQLASLSATRLPFTVLSIYGEAGRHYAWLSLTRPIQKKLAEKPAA